MKQRYTVTTASNATIAGQRVSPGDALELTAEQAYYPLLEGIIAPERAPAPDGNDEPAEPAADITRSKRRRSEPDTE